MVRSVLDDSGSTTTADTPRSEIDSLYRCSVCGAAYVPRSKRHVRTCGDARCRSRHAARREAADPARREAKAARWRERTEQHSAYYTARTVLRRAGLLTPEALARLEPLRGIGRLPVAEALARCGIERPEPPPRRARAVPARDPEPTRDAWSLPSPDHTAPIALAVQLRFSQRGIPRQRIRDYGGARVLHGALHRAVDVGHSRAAPAWSLVLPSPRDARLWLVAYRADVLDRLPRSVLLAGDDEPHELAFGLRSVLRAPPARAPGSYRVRVHCETPLVLRRGISRAARERGERDPHDLQDAPATISGSLLQVATRIGLAGIAHDHVVTTVRKRDVERVMDDDGEDGVRVGSHWRIGEHRGRIACLVGWLDVECNAPARWLLDCAERVGLGAKTALGFGRVRVEDL